MVATQKTALPAVHVIVINKTEVSTITVAPVFLGDIASVNPQFTMEYLFEKVEKYLRDKDRVVTVSYHPVYGFPENVSAAFKRPLVVDSFVVTGFIPIVYIPPRFPTEQ